MTNQNTNNANRPPPIFVVTTPCQHHQGDLSREIDKNVKGSVAVFCGKEKYEVGVGLNDVSFF
jgi:hypothetical protein